MDDATPLTWANRTDQHHADPSDDPLKVAARVRIPLGLLEKTRGTIRVRENRDGSKSYVCQVKLGRDPGTGKARVLTGTAKSERAAHRLLHELIAKAEDRSQHASDATVATVIEQWLATGGPAGEATRQVYAGYIRLHVLPRSATCRCASSASPISSAGTHPFATRGSVRRRSGRPTRSSGPRSRRRCGGGGRRPMSPRSPGRRSFRRR